MLNFFLLHAFFVKRHLDLNILSFCITFLATDYRLFHTTVAISASDDIFDRIHICIFQHPEELFQNFVHVGCDFCFRAI